MVYPVIYRKCLQRPPNFLLQAELCTYVTQEVVVPPEEDEQQEGNLIDTSDVSFDQIDNRSQQSLSPGPSHSPLQAHIDAIAERDNLIKHLQQELERLRLNNFHIIFPETKLLCFIDMIMVG